MSVEFTCEFFSNCRQPEAHKVGPEQGQDAEGPLLQLVVLVGLRTATGQGALLHLYSDMRLLDVDDAGKVCYGAS